MFKLKTILASIALLASVSVNAQLLYKVEGNGPKSPPTFSELTTSLPSLSSTRLVQASLSPRQSKWSEKST